MMSCTSFTRNKNAAPKNVAAANAIVASSAPNFWKKRRAALSPAESESKKPVEKKIRADRQKTYHHRSVAFTDRVERRVQHFQDRVGNEADCIKLQRTCSLPRHFGSEPSVLVNHTDDWRRQHRQSDRRWNRKQKREPHSTSQDRAKLGRVSESGA